MRFNDILKINFRKPETIVFWCSGALGVLFFCILFGLRVLNPWEDEWLMNKGDLSQHYLGWCFYRNSSWCFPIGLFDGCTYPYQSSIIFTDSIPILCVICKTLNPILPDSFQFIGIYELLCFFLQGALGGLLTYRVSRNKTFSIVFSVFFITAPCFFSRTFRHTALSSHYLILYALLLYLDANRNFKKEITQWCLILILAASIHFCIVPIVAIILVFYCIRFFLFQKKVFATLLQLVIPILLCGTVMYLLGGFSSQTSPVSSANCIGLGYRSANLNMLWNPIDTNNSLVLPSSKVYNQFQDEGVSYLGLGGLVGLIIGIICLCISKILGKSISVSSSFIMINFVMCVVLLVLSLSPRVTLGDKVLIDYSSILPKPIIGIWEVLRSSGRLVWPVYYLILLFIAYQQKSLFNNRRKIATVCMVLMLVLQLVDILPGMISTAQNRVAVSFYSTIPPDITADLKRKDIMLFDRPLLCTEDLNDYSEFLYVAIKNKMKINTFYLARYDEELMVNQFQTILSNLIDSIQMDNAIIVASGSDSTYSFPSSRFLM